MAVSIEEFINTFHALTGTTIGERRKCLFDLLHRTNANIDFNLIQPKTPLEENFKVEILLHFKKIPDLIEILKSENPVHIAKILKESSWFLSNMFDYVTYDDLVEKIFPHISFNAKVKLINKLSVHINNPSDGDKLFYAVQKRYGNYLATKLLPCCSGDLILQCLKTLKIEITSRQLLIIIKKHPELSEEILEALKHFSSNDILRKKYKDVFIHILKNNLALFLKYDAVCKIDCRLGRRSTDRLITTNKTNVTIQAKVLYNYLHHKQLGKTFRQDFNEFFLKMFPASLSEFKTKINYYIDIINNVRSYDSKLNLVSTTFQQVYGSEIWQHSDCITVALLELMTVKDRELWMNTNPKPPKIPIDVWNCLWKIEKSVPLIKSKISLTSTTKERAELLGCLVETCRINKDYNALVDVCKYVVTQHRNDDASVIYCFLNSLKKCYKFSELNEQIWKYINDMVRIFISKKSYPFYFSEWVFEYLNFLLINDLPIKEYLTDPSRKTLTGNVWNSYAKNKKILEKCGEFILEMYSEEELMNQYVQYYDNVLRWNRSHPTNKISLPYKDAIKTMTDYLSKKDSYSFTYSCYDILGKFLSLNLEDADLEVCLKALIDREAGYVRLEVFGHLLKYRPLIVLKHIEKITKMILNMWYTMVKPYFWMFSKNYSHLEIPQKIIAVCLNTLKMEGESLKKNSITALSCLMDPSDFTNLIQPYYPDESKMEVDNDNQEIYQLQQAITASLKYVIPPSVIMGSVLNFTKGDYMKFIQRALHSISHNTSEENLVPFYNALVDRPVSVRKNVVYLTYKVLDCKEISTMLAQFTTTEKNASIHKFIFKALFNYFLKNPNNSSWELVQNNLKIVNDSDEEVVDILTQTHKVSPLFFNKYLIFALEYLESIPESKKSNEGIMNLLNAITPTVVSTLPEKILWEIIRKYLFKKKSLTDAVQLLACRFSIYVEGNEEKPIVLLFNFIKQHIIDTWQSANGRSEGRKCVNQLIVRFCEVFVHDKSAPRHALRKFDTLWNSLLKPHQAFAEFLQLQFTLLYVDCADLNLNCAQIADRLGTICKNLELYDTAISTELGDVLNSFMPLLLKGNEELEEIKRLNLISHIIKHETKLCLLIAIYLLPVELPELNEVIVQYEDIIKQLERNHEPTVKFALPLHFQKHSLCTIFGNNKTEIQFYKDRGICRFIEEFTNKYRQLC